MRLHKAYMFLFIFLWGCSTTIVGGNDFVYSTPSLLEREKFQDYINKGYIEIGMTKEEVRASWGEPKSIKQKRTKNYEEIWVYVPNWKFRNQLYFNRGVLVKTEPDYLVVSRMDGHGILP